MKTALFSIGIVLLFLASSGCNDERYTALTNGYGEVSRGSNLPHSSWSVGLVHDGEHGRKVIWNSLSAGYGDTGPIIHDGVVVFVGNTSDGAQGESIHHIFVATDGPPTVEITDFLMSSANKNAGMINLRFSILEPEAKIGVRFRYYSLDSFGNARPDPIFVTLTWDELRELVSRAKKSGARLEYHGLVYYKL